MSKEYKHPHLQVPEGGNGAYCPMEPEKKDVWRVGGNCKLCGRGDCPSVGGEYGIVGCKKDVWEAEI